MWPAESSKKTFLPLTPYVIVSMMTYKVRGVWDEFIPAKWKRKWLKRGLPYLKYNFFSKKIDCQPENIIIYNIISFFKTLKEGKKTSWCSYDEQNERSLGTN